MKNQNIFDYLDSADFDVLFEPPAPAVEKTQEPEKKTDEERKAETTEEQTKTESNEQLAKIDTQELEGGESSDEWEKQEDEQPEQEEVKVPEPKSDTPEKKQTKDQSSEDSSSSAKIVEASNKTPTKLEAPSEEQKSIPPPEEAKYPNQKWFIKWKETLLLCNIKACILHTYNKAMAYRNHMIETDSHY